MMRDVPKTPLRGDARVSATARLLACVWLVAIAVGCSPQKPNDEVTTVPAPTFTGPKYLHGTVGSLTKLSGYYPMIVSGYSIVSGLDGTGSADVPAFLRSWLENEMRRRGVGSLRMGAGHLSPKRMLASDETAVVLVQGVIPPGAPKGTTFDVLVSALPRTQTTSLQDGHLWTTEMSMGAENPRLMRLNTLALSRGPLYINPFSNTLDDEEKKKLRRRSIVLGGGVVAEDREIALVLNNESWTRSRLIADRINERFPADPGDRFQTANAKSDAMIKLHVPGRFSREPGRLLKLIEHLYVQGGDGFEPLMAQRLIDTLQDHPENRESVSFALESLGKTCLPVMRKYYDAPQLHVRRAVLRAGVRLEDQLTGEPLMKLSTSADPAVRQEVAGLLVHLPRSADAVVTLRRLLDDENTLVRLMAYESLVANNDEMVSRHPIMEGEQYKFVLDLVPSETPLIYISHGRVPRVAIFNPDSGFKGAGVYRIWGNRLMVRVSESGVASVFYQPNGEAETKQQDIAAKVSHLVSLLGRTPTLDDPVEGFSLSYSRVVGALYALWESGALAGELHVRMSPLSRMIEEAKEQGFDKPRDEFGPRPEDASPQPTDSDLPPVTRDDLRDEGLMPVAP